MKRGKLISGEEPTSPLSGLDSQGERVAMLSPSSGHRDYNRYKYYSALRTGYKHLGKEDGEFLAPPKHVLEENLFIIHNPFNPPRKCLPLLVTYPNSSYSCGWWETKFDGYHIQRLEDYDRVGSNYITLGFPVVWLDRGAHNRVYELLSIVLHMHADY